MTDDTNKAIERHMKLLEVMVSETGSYHNHKETMAHAGTALQLALMSWLVSQGVWPPSWVPGGSCISARTITLLSFSLVWLLLHVFIRWQLRKRRIAALESATYIKTLRKWASAPPSADGLRPYAEKRDKRTAWAWVKEAFDFFLPVSAALPRRDVSESGYPADMVIEWQEQEKEGSGAICSEWFLFFASVTMFLIGLSRIICDP